MTVPYDVASLQVDNLAVPNAVRNHSGDRGMTDWYVPSSLGSSVAATGAGTYGGRAMRITSFGGATPLRHVRVPVTAGWQLEVGYKAAIASGTAPADNWSTQVNWYDGEGAQAAAPTVLYTGTAVADLTTIVTVPATAVYGELRMSLTEVAAAMQVYVSRVSLRQLPPATAFPVEPPESWLDVTGKSVTINAEGGNLLDGVEDLVEPGYLNATIVDSAVDPAVNTTIRRGRRLVLSALVSGTRYYVWEGRLETADANYDEKGRVIVSLTATDSARVLNDGRVAFVRDYATATDSAIAEVAGKIGIGAYGGQSSPLFDTTLPVGARSDGSTAADWIVRACNTDDGSGVRRAWVDQRDVLQIRRVSALGSSPVVTLSDDYSDVGAIYYTGLSLNYGSRSCVAALNVTRFNVDETFDDGAKTYGPYVASSGEVAAGRLETTAEILNGSPSAYAASVLPVFAVPSIFPTEIKLDALRDLPRTLSLAPYQPIRIKRSTTLNRTVRLLRIRHEITGYKWNVYLTPRPIEATAAGVVVTNPAAGADTGPAENVVLNTKPLAARERTTTLTIGTGTETVVNFNGSVQADGIPWDSTNAEFTVPRTGRYDVTVNVEWVAAATGFRRIYLRRNGTSVRRQTNSPDTANGVTQTITGTWRFTAGQKIRVGAFQNAGANRSIGFDETNIQIKFAD